MRHGAPNPQDLTSNKKAPVRVLLTPKGERAGKMDRVMLLYMWAQQLIEENKKSHSDPTRDIIIAGIGRPTFPINPFATKSAEQYWANMWSKAQEARHILTGESVGVKTSRDEVAAMGAVIGYGDPSGDQDPRITMAAALSKWYSIKGTTLDIKPDDLLFTPGGAAALYIIFKILNERNPGGRILTPVPYYSLYAGSEGQNNLHAIPVMDQPGYALSAECVRKSILSAQALSRKDGFPISALLLCDPNNPLGTIIDEKELRKIGNVLKEFSTLNFPIILDEAYAELRHDGQKHISLLSIAPELKHRIIFIRSATKALSAAGERMAVVTAFDRSFKNALLQKSISIFGHAPRSLQYAFAEAMSKLNEIELKTITKYYVGAVNEVKNGLEKIGIAMPDRLYEVGGAFYVAGDFSELFGLDMPLAAKNTFAVWQYDGKKLSRSLNKSNNKLGKVRTDEDIAYYLLHKDGMMFAPFSYFGASPKKGFVRITCCGGDNEIIEMLERLESRFLEVRKQKRNSLLIEINAFLEKFSGLGDLGKNEYKAFVIEKTQLEEKSNNNLTALELKIINQKLKDLLIELKATYAHKKMGTAGQDEENLLDEEVFVKTEELEKAAITLQSIRRRYLAQKAVEEHSNDLKVKWRDFAEKMQAEGPVRTALLLSKPSERHSSSFWKLYLNNREAFDEIVPKAKTPKQTSPTTSSQSISPVEDKTPKFGK